MTATMFSERLPEADIIHALLGLLMIESDPSKVTNAIRLMTGRERRHAYRQLVENMTASTKKSMPWELSKLVMSLAYCAYVGYDVGEANYEVKDEHEKDNCHFAYISYPRDLFLKHLFSAARNSRGRFVDVGCGIGDKVLLAHASGLFETVSGIEYNRMTSVHAHMIMDNMRLDAAIHNGDAFDVDFGRFDFIYLYMPINKREKLIELYKHIARTMPVNGLIMEVGAKEEVRQAFEEMAEEDTEVIVGFEEKESVRCAVVKKYAENEYVVFNCDVYNSDHV